MFTIFKRDFLAYFRTPVGYVFMGVFLDALRPDFLPL